MDVEADKGDIIAQSRIPIYPDDTIAEVDARAREAGIAFIREFLPRLEDGTTPRVPQN